MQNIIRQPINDLNNLNIYKNERILSSDLKCSSLIEIPHSNETRVKKEENDIKNKNPYSQIELLKINLEKKEKRIKELEKENDNLKQINQSLIKTLSQYDEILLNLKKENQNITRQYNRNLLEKENIKRGSMINGFLELEKPSMKLLHPFRSKPKGKLSSCPLKIDTRSDKEEGLEDYMRKHGLFTPLLRLTENDKKKIEEISPLKTINKLDINTLILPKSISSLKINSSVVKNSQRDNLLSPKANSSNSKGILSTENVIKTTNFSSQKDYSPNDDSSIQTGDGIDFYNQLMRVQSRHGNRFRFSKYRPSFLTLKEDFLSKLIKSENIKEIFHITNTGEDFISSLKTFKKDKIKLIGETINNTFRDYISSLRVIIRVKHFLNVSIKVSNAMAVEEATNMIIKNACEILECDRTSIFVYDKFTKLLNVYQGEGLEDLKLKISIDKGIVGYVFTKGERLRIDDAYLDSRFNKEIDMETGYKTKTLLCTPLKNSVGEVFGVLQSINKNNGMFNSDDEEIMELFGIQASLILSNSLYFDDNASFVFRMITLIEYTVILQNVKSLLEFTLETENTMFNLWKINTSKVLLLIEGKLIHYEKYQITEYKTYLGLIGQVFNKKEFIGIENSNENPFYNALVDIETSNSILTFPLIDSSLKLLGICQTSYGNKLLKGAVKPQEIDMTIIDYLSKILSRWLENYFLKNS